MILVTGGTGFVGRGVVQELVGHGHRVRVMSRSPGGVPAGAEWAGGDAADLEAVRRAMEGCRRVIHLVAIRRQWRDRTFEKVTAGSARAVARAAAAAGVERLVLMSALGLEAAPATGYMRAKAEAERAVRESGVPFTIFRASFVVGPGGFVEEYAGLIRRAPVVPIPGNGGYPVQPIDRDDVAAAFRLALASPRAASRTYDLAGPERVTFAAFVEHIAVALGARKPLIRVPLALMRPMAAVLERLTPNPPATTDELRMLVAGNVGDPGPAERDLGLRLTPLDEAVRKAVAGLAGPA